MSGVHAKDNGESAYTPNTLDIAPRPNNEQRKENIHTATGADEAPEKHECSMPSMSALYVYLVALCCGVSMMMPVNAVFSAPDYIMNYYKYAMQDEHAVTRHAAFWDNSLTFYNLISMVTALVMEPLTLTATFRRVPILTRLLAGLLVLVSAIILLMAVPACGTTDVGAIITICCASFIGGSGTSIFESTVYGMFSTFPPSFTSTMMFGVGISGVLTSLIQIIVKAALGEGFDSVVTQSKIYYGLDVGIQGITFIMLIMLRFNSYARNHFGDLGGVVSKTDTGYEQLQQAQEAERSDFSAEHCAKSDSDVAEPGKAHGGDDVGAAATGSAPQGAPQLTSNDVLLATDIFGTFKKVIWMFVACGFNFFITLMLFPTVVVTANIADYWFPTVAVFIFNVLDAMGRFTPSFKFMWPKTYKQRYIIVAASFARVIFVPLLILYSYGYIPSHAYGYVMMVIFGYSNGYIGSMSLVLGPKSKGIIHDGQRFVVGTLMGISILVGATIGSVLAIAIGVSRMH